MIIHKFKTKNIVLKSSTSGTPRTLNLGSLLNYPDNVLKTNDQ